MRILFWIAAAGVLLLGIGAGSVQSATVSTSLTAGWNHVCYSGEERSVEEALGEITGSVQALYRIEAGGALERWFPGRPEISTITTLAPQDPLMMLMAAPVAWTQTSDGAASEAADMEKGWNSICYEGESEDVEGAIKGISGQVAIIYALVPGQGWLRFVPGREEISNLERVEPHQALLVLVSDPAGATWDFGGEVALPPLTPLDPSVQAKAHQIRDVVSLIRGLPPNSGMQEGTISRAALTDYYQQVAEKTRQEEGEKLEELNLVYRLLHLIGPEDDLLAIDTEFSASNILGFYAPSEDKLALVAEESATIDPQDEMTLAHEYVHSSQDGRFDIEKLNELAENEEKSHSNTEYGSTVRCLIEGDATLASVAYMADTYGPDWIEQLLPSDEEDGNSDIPPGMTRYYYFPYAQGGDFVFLLFLQGGWEAVNGAYEDIPTSTEQILHPEKYTSHEAPGAMSLPDIAAQLGPGWKQSEDAAFGEFDVYNYLLTSLEGQSGWDSVAQEAAAGWGVGRLASYTPDDGARVVLHLSLQWDSPGDLSEFVDAFQQVAGATAGQWWPSDSSFSTVRWDDAAEHGFATWHGSSFVALMSPSVDDLRAGVAAAGYNLDAAVNPTLPAPPH